jgi:polyisoprenoid-binding protein YceI
MKRLSFALVLSAACVLLASPARSQEVVVELDPAQTQINFTLGDILHTVHGSFKLKRGVIRYDTSTGKAGGEIIVDATSGDSGNASRDRKMHAEILESQKFPEITFLLDAVHAPAGVPGPAGIPKTTAPQNESPQNNSPVQFHGLFKLHGSAHELTLTAQVQVIDGRPSATIHFVVPYVQWGLKNPSTFILRVSDKVDIDIHTSGRM